MVNLRIQIWAPAPSPLPDGEKARRKLGPIYDLSAVQSLAVGDQIFIATENCDEHLVQLDWDVDDVAKLVASLTTSDYYSSEWCKGKNGIVIDADVYTINYDNVSECRGSQSDPKYYIKFGFRNNATDLLILVFSCHLTRF